jgi:hypothetical protein
MKLQFMGDIAGLLDGAIPVKDKDWLQNFKKLEFISWTGTTALRRKMVEIILCIGCYLFFIIGNLR